MDQLQTFLLGVIVTSCVVIGLFFCKYWLRTRDRLFLAFAVGFWLFGINWAGLAVVHNEGVVSMYVLRILGFACIIAGVVGKNLEARRNAK